MSSLIIFGASGHGKVLADIAFSMGRWDNIEFYDDRWPSLNFNSTIEVIGDSSKLFSLKTRPELVVAIGDNRVRFAKQSEFISHGFKLATLIHPFTYISRSAKIHHGTVIMPGAVVNSNATIGSGCIINSNAVVEHDCELGPAVHLSPGSCLAGGVKVGQYSWLGIGSSVIQLKTIGKNVIIGANAAVISDMPDNVTAVGVPAKIIK